MELNDWSIIDDGRLLSTSKLTILLVAFLALLLLSRSRYYIADRESHHESIAFNIPRDPEKPQTNTLNMFDCLVHLNLSLSWRLNPN